MTFIEGKALYKLCRKSKPFQEKQQLEKELPGNCTLWRVNMEIPQKQSGHWRFKYKKHKNTSWNDLTYGGDNHSCQQDGKVLTVNETTFKNITSTWQCIYLANVTKMLKTLPDCFNCSYLPSCFSGLESLPSPGKAFQSREQGQILLVMRF